MFASKEDFKKAYRDRMISRFTKEVQEATTAEQFVALGELTREYAAKNWKKTKEAERKEETKKLYYFSMEFLIGRLMTNNLMNLGIYDIVKDGLADFGVDINELENMESDAGLGNGGLGRLAACFLDSLASLNYAGNGICIRYQYGLFKQKIENGYQVEVPDQWLKYGNVWEVRKVKYAVDVKFYGHVNLIPAENGKFKVVYENAEVVKAVPYDVPVIGANTTQTNTLRLWDAQPSEQLPKGKSFIEYLNDLREITLNVYPDDSTDHGRILRIKQEYFFVAAGLSAIVDKHLAIYHTLDNLPEKIVIQLNDTHPVLCIPELMRILMDEHDYSWDDAWSIVTRTMCYTNHTILHEALEKWPVSYIQPLLPRIFMIISEIDKRFRMSLHNDYDKINNCAIIKDNLVYMGNLAVVASKSVNGVARLHTEIIKEDVFRHFNQIWPEKFNNKTNGITHRRWLLYSNPQLRALLNKYIGKDFETDMSKLEKLLDHVDDKQLQAEFMEVKKERKEILAKLVKETTGVEIDTNSIIDVQAKRLHAYKRQLLNILHVIHLYQKMKADPNYRIYPHTYIFAAKAAPAYVFAKQVIKLINSVADVVNNDPEISKYMKVVFIPNYNVSIAEKLMNAADVSEQISTAGKEASGTGNMKFMMNGAITLGTLDGANVEIDELVGRENDVIFGLTKEEVYHERQFYNSMNLYRSNEVIRQVVDSLIDGTFSANHDEFRAIYDDLMYHNDEYLVLRDFESYCNACDEVERRYLDKENWAKTCLINIAKSGFFTSDRTIEQYAQEIWQLDKVKY